MTSLHYTLIALAIGLVGAMFLYNLYQERRSRKQAEQMLGLGEVGEKPGQDGPNLGVGEPGETELMTDSRIEPRIDLSDLPDVGETEPSAAFLEREPAPETTVDQAPFEYPSQHEPPLAAAAPRMEPESPLDGAIEYVARLRYAQPITISFTTLQDNLRRISKPIRLVGQREDGEWEPVLSHTGRPYETVELSLLLADRAGPVSEAQIDAFCRRLYEFATEHGGAVSCQDKAEALARAGALDTFCAGVDMLIGLNIIPEAGLEFPLHAVYELAEGAGLTRNTDGSYVLRDASDQALFNLALHSEPLPGGGSDGQGCQGVSLLFDVPRVAHGIEAFDRMAALGFDMAEALGGQLVDDGGRQVSRESLFKDRSRLEAIYDSMEQHGIPAGGERALRLFA